MELEVARATSRAAMRPGRRQDATIQVRLSRVLDLTDANTLLALGLDRTQITADDLTTTRDLGEAAHYLGFEAILAPSATGHGNVLAILVTNRAATSDIEVMSDKS